MSKSNLIRLIQNIQYRLTLFLSFIILMETNILQLIINFTKSPISEIEKEYTSRNRINSMGDALESLIKDLLCDSYWESNLQEKLKTQEKYLSYSWNTSNPPDIIIRGGDAIEVKKIESSNSQIALNSSYPKSKLSIQDSKIAKKCKECEEWQEKDLLYIVGNILPKTSKLRYLRMVYGDLYAASSEIYERAFEKLANWINVISDMEFSKTKELGRVNKVDPLGITYLRIRWMWWIDNPIKVFNYLEEWYSENETFSLKLLLRKDKFESFPEDAKNEIVSLSEQWTLLMKDVLIKSPDNPVELIEAILIKFTI